MIIADVKNDILRMKRIFEAFSEAETVVDTILAAESKMIKLDVEIKKLKAAKDEADRELDFVNGTIKEAKAKHKADKAEAELAVKKVLDAGYEAKIAQDEEIHAEYVAVKESIVAKKSELATVLADIEAKQKDLDKLNNEISRVTSKIKSLSE